jgi:hypothetical protein
MRTLTNKSRFHSFLPTPATWFALLWLGSGLVYAQTAGGAQQGKAGVKKAAATAAAEEEESGPATAPARVQPIRIARPAELKETSMSGAYHFYLGTPHSHSGYSGDHAKVIATKFNHGVANYELHRPAEVFARAKTNFYDFYFITDHSSPEQNEFYLNGMTDEHWAATRQQAEAATTSDFLALRGYEFSRNVNPDNGGLGHMSVLNSLAWNSAYAAGHTFSWLYDWMGTQTNALVVAQFNHPQPPGKPRVKNFKNYEGRTKERNEVVRLAEIWNSGEKMSYVPTVKKIWALGWKVAPTAGTDVHGPWGVENRRLRTGVLAESLTADAIMRALKARRVYATLEPTLHLEFTLNGVMMGTALDRCPPGDLKAKVFVNDPAGTAMSKVEVYGSKYETNGGADDRLATLPVSPGSKIVEGSVPGGYDFYYVAVYKEGTDTARAFTAPIWMDNQ